MPTEFESALDSIISKTLRAHRRAEELFCTIRRYSRDFPTCKTFDISPTVKINGLVAIVVEFESHLSQLQADRRALEWELEEACRKPSHDPMSLYKNQTTIVLQQFQSCLDTISVQLSMLNTILRDMKANVGWQRAIVVNSIVNVGVVVGSVIALVRWSQK